MSKLLTFLFLLILAGLVGGFAYLALVDVPIAQDIVTQETTLYELQIQKGTVE